AAKDWSGVMTHLPHGFRVLRFDLRGHGASQKPPGPYRIQDFTGDLVALMDAVGFERAHVAGFSLGGLIAQSLALSHPERVDRLALLSTVAGRTEKERERVQGRLDFIASSHPAAYFDQSVPRWFTPGFIAENPDLIAEKKRIVSSMDQAAYAAAYHALAFTDFGEDLSAIRAETLVATGENDIGSNPRMARFMATTIPHARLRILPDLHHSILIEAPGLVAGMLAEFFQDGTVKETP
ncbi:MAG: alpha/beta fold hydrolase, partial [Pseudomonadota bacterium]